MKWRERLGYVFNPHSLKEGMERSHRRTIASEVSRIWLQFTTWTHYTTLQLHITPPQTTTPIIHCTYDTHIPIHHCTNHTAVTNHSLALIVSPHLHLIHTRTLPCTHRKVLFLPRLTFLSVTHPAVCYLCVWPRTARPWNSEPVPVTPTSAWYCLRLCPASDIPVFARWPLPVWFCLCLINILLQMDPHAFDQSLQEDYCPDIEYFLRQFKFSVCNWFFIACLNISKCPREVLYWSKESMVPLSIFTVYSVPIPIGC